jgi:hypothetical protein
MLFENPLANALRGSFREWCYSTSKTKAALRDLTPETLKMIDLSLGELNSYGPGPWWTWYVRNHMRFRIRGDEMRVAGDLIQSYLADYAHGRLERKLMRKETTNVEIGKENGDSRSPEKESGKTKRKLLS